MTDREIAQAHELMKRQEFAEDFVERYLERCDQEIGLCNLPVDTLENETELLSAAYELYQNMQDCNCAFNDTLNSVFEKVELLVQQKELYLRSA